MSGARAVLAPAPRLWRVLGDPERSVQLSTVDTWPAAATVRQVVKVHTLIAAVPLLARCDTIRPPPLS